MGRCGGKNYSKNVVAFSSARHVASGIGKQRREYLDLRSLRGSHRPSDNEYESCNAIIL